METPHDQSPHTTADVLAGSPIRILLLEDSALDAQLVKALLEKSVSPTYVVRHVDTVSAALQVLTEGATDLVLADLNVPDSIGVSTIRSLTAAAPTLPVVSLTASDSGDISRETMRAGAEDFVVKGEGSPSMLRRILVNAIERKRLNNELKEALDRVRRLEGLLPICAWCKKVRRDDGYYQEIEGYIAEHSDATFTHGICPDCIPKMRERKK